MRKRFPGLFFLLDLFVVYVGAVLIGLALVLVPSDWIPFDLPATKTLYDVSKIVLLVFPLLILREVIGTRYDDLKIVRIIFFLSPGIRDELKRDNELSYDELRRRRRLRSWRGFPSNFALFSMLVMAVFVTVYRLEPILLGKVRYDALGAAASCIDQTIAQQDKAKENCARLLAEAEGYLGRAREYEIMSPDGYWLGYGYLKMFNGDGFCGLPAYEALRSMSGSSTDRHPYQVLTQFQASVRLTEALRKCDEAQQANAAFQAEIIQLRREIEALATHDPLISTVPNFGPQ
jgi:hypothetical protein